MIGKTQTTEKQAIEEEISAILAEARERETKSFLEMADKRQIKIDLENERSPDTTCCINWNL